MLSLEKPDSIRKEIRASIVPRWRYISRRIFKPAIVNIDGIRIRADLTRMNFQNAKLLYRGNYEAEERIIVKGLLKPGDHVLEGGAGMGLITTTAAQIVGEKNITSYEPMPVTYSLLSENLHTNGFDIKHLQRALGAKAGKADFHAQDDLLSSSFLERKGNGRTIEVVTDGITDALAQSEANVLILDIEGGEIDVLNSESFSQIDKMIIEMHPQLVGMNAVSDTVKKLSLDGLHLRRDYSYGKVLAFTRK